MIFNTIVNVLKGLVKAIGKVPIKDIIFDMLKVLPALIEQMETVLQFKKDGLSKDEIQILIDDAMETFDDNTGDKGIKLFNNLSPANAEKGADGFKMATKAALYNKYEINADL